MNMHLLKNMKNFSDANKALQEDLKKYEEISANNASENPQELLILKQKIVENMINIDKHTLFKDDDNKGAGTVDDISEKDVTKASASNKLSFNSGVVLMNIINEAKEQKPTPVVE